MLNAIGASRSALLGRSTRWIRDAICHDWQRTFLSQAIQQDRYLVSSFDTHRFASSTTKTKKVNKKKRKKTDISALGSPILIYQRDKDRINIPRVFLGAASFSVLYWFWYCVDFVPTVNASPYSAIQGSYSIGLVGLGLSSIILAGTVFYPLSLISRIGFDEITQELLLCSHKLPFLAESEPVRMPLVDVSLDERTAEAQGIKKRGTFVDFSSHVSIKTKEQKGPFPYLLSIGKGKEVVNDDLMMQVFVGTDSLKKKKLTRKGKRKNTGRMKNHAKR